jgi:hypothetical protein
MPADVWFSRGDQNFGPYPHEDALRFVREGNFLAEDQATHENKWFQVSAHPTLASAIPAPVAQPKQAKPRQSKPKRESIKDEPARRPKAKAKSKEKGKGSFLSKAEQAVAELEAKAFGRAGHLAKINYPRESAGGYGSGKGWRSQPISVRQKKVLAFFKVPEQARMTKGDASEIIDELYLDPDKEIRWRAYCKVTGDWDDTPGLFPYSEKDLDKWIRERSGDDEEFVRPRTLKQQFIWLLLLPVRVLVLKPIFYVLALIFSTLKFLLKLVGATLALVLGFIILLIVIGFAMYLFQLFTG